MDYKSGLRTLKSSLPTDAQEEFSVLEGRLTDNLDREQLYGSTETTRAERAQIISGLNRLSITHFGVSFNDLCTSKQLSTGAIPSLGSQALIKEIRESTERIIKEMGQGREEDRQVSVQLLTALEQHQVEQAEATRVVTELRAWAQSVQTSGLPVDLGLRTKLETLTQHNSSSYQYLQVALPIIPGILSYNVELGSQHQADLATIWERIKTRLTKRKGKGDGATESKESSYGSGHRWAVLIGINEYEDKANYGQLKYCGTDVQSIQKQLVAGGFDGERIRLLTDQTQEVPTRANILTVLTAVANSTEPDDLLLLYYSGHGDENGGESYLVARDGHALTLADSGVSVTRVKEIIQAAKARAKVIIVDACHSGANIGGKGPKPMSEAFIRRVFEQAEGMAILAACKQGQLSYEWHDKEQGVFTYYLLEALSGSADRDGKGFITIQDVSRHVTDGVVLWASQNNVDQKPTLEYRVAGDIIILAEIREVHNT